MRNSNLRLFSPVKPAALLLVAAVLIQPASSAINLTRAAGNQFETAVAINPNDANQVIVVSRNEAVGLYTARSSDGGATWTRQLIGRFTVPAAGDIPRAYGNPSVAWDAFGNLFLAYLSQSSAAASTYVTLSLSRDGGATFFSPAGTGPAMLLPQSTNGQPVSGDQPTVTVGPGSAGFPGSVWLTYWTIGGIAVSGAGVSGPGQVGPFTSLQPDQPSAVNFGDIAVGPKGEVIVTYGPNGGRSGAIYVNVKRDGLGPGSFSRAAAVTSVNIGGFTLIPAQPNWGIDPEAGLAWDRSAGPHRGRVYLVYTDAPAPGSSDTNIFVVYSDDAGVTWSKPVRVNDDTGTNSQFLPHLSVDQSDGDLAVTWYDARNSALNDSTQYLGSFSIDGGNTFTANFVISPGTSNSARSPFVGRKADYGDYTGNAFANGRLIPAWADNSNTTADNPDAATSFDVYAAVIQAPAQSGQPPAIRPGGVINASAFGGQAGVAPGTWIEIYGSNLAQVERDWSLADFNGANAPVELAGVRVTVNGTSAGISHVGPRQVNAEVPAGIGLGPVAVVVFNHGIASDPEFVQASTVLPGLLAPAAFTAASRQYVVAFAGDGKTLVGVPDGFLGGRPARPGEAITLYGIGFGPVSPEWTPGTVAAVPSRLQNPLTVYLDSTLVDTSSAGTYAGLAPGTVGLYQFNFVVPPLADGDHELSVTVACVSAQKGLRLSTRN